MTQMKNKKNQHVIISNMSSAVCTLKLINGKGVHMAANLKSHFIFTHLIGLTQLDSSYHLSVCPLAWRVSLGKFSKDQFIN